MDSADVYIINFPEAGTFHSRMLTAVDLKYKIIRIRLDIIHRGGIDGGGSGCQDPMPAAPLDDLKVPIRHHYAT